MGVYLANDAKFEIHLSVLYWMKMVVCPVKQVRSRDKEDQNSDDGEESCGGGAHWEEAWV